MTSKQYLDMGLSTLREAHTLELLAERDLTISEIANEHLSRVSLTAIVDKFEVMRLVKRVRSKDDRRKIVLTLTEKGREIFAKDKEEQTAVFEAEMLLNLSSLTESE
jgi:DNA-binding MarR family transcriptional regulator